MEKNPLLAQLQAEIKALNDPVYFAEHILTEKLWDKQKEILTEFYNPNKKYRELVICAGMRSSKTYLASIICLFEAFKLLLMKDPAAHYGISKGHKIFIINVATSEQQAKDTVFSQIESKLKNSKWFMDLKPQIRHQEIRFPDKNLVIRSEHSNSASLVGKTAKCVVFDELSRFKDTQGKNSAEAVYESLSRAVQTFGEEGKVISISSPLYQDELLMRLLKLSKKSPYILGYHLATWELNPNITRESLEHEFNKNPEAAMRDYGAIPSSALEIYFKQPEKIDEAVDLLLKPIVFDGVLSSFVSGKPNYSYYLGGDPALKNDSFGLALVHKEGDTVICDLSYRLTPTKEREISALEVKNLILSITKQFNVQEAVFDTWHFPETLEEIANQGVKVSQSIVRKVHYDNLKELFYTGKIRIPQNEVLINELKNLELIKGNKVDHPKHGSKDLADALANACYLLRSSKVAQPQPPAWHVISSPI